MKTMGVLILTGAFIAASTIPTTAFAGRGMGAGNGNNIQTKQQTSTMRQSQIRLCDGSNCQATQIKSGAMEKKGNAYGPGDGTGVKVAPKDGTGYGAPSKR